MKRFHFALIVVATLSISAFAKSASDEEAVRKLHAEYDKAALTQDAAIFERLLHPDYTMIFPDSDGSVKPVTKATVVEDAKAGTVKYEIGLDENVTVKVYGNMAIVRGRWTDKGISKGRPFGGAYLYTTVYIKNKGKWQIISDQGTLIAEQKPKP